MVKQDIKSKEISKKLIYKEMRFIDITKTQYWYVVSIILI